jgi:hypothetical protein
MTYTTEELKTVWVKLSGHTYPIHIGADIFPILGEELVR